MKKNIILLAIFVTTGLVSNANSATTYYEVWRSTTPYSADAVRIKQWHTETSYDDLDVVQGQHYYYWIRALACKYVENEGYTGLDYLWTKATILCPIYATEGWPSPLRVYSYIQGNYWDGSTSKNWHFAINEQNTGWPDEEIDSWDWPVYLGYDFGEDVFENSWNKDLLLEPYADFGEAKIYFEFLQGLSAYMSTDPVIAVNVRSDPDPGPTSYATQGTHSDKIVVTWGAIENICSEITADGALSPKCDGWITPAPTLSLISISGMSLVNEDSGEQYICTAHYSDGSSNTITSSAVWTENSSYASMNANGYLTTSSVSSDQSCTITANYQGKTDTHNITIKNVTNPLPDLVITELYPDPAPSGSTFYVGDNIDWRIRVQNNGDGLAEESWVGYYIGNSSSDFSTPLAEDPDDKVDLLNAGESVTKGSLHAFTIDDVGQKYIIVKVDYKNEIDESNNNNNTEFYGPFTVAQPTGSLMVNITPPEVANEAKWYLFGNGYSSEWQPTGQEFPDIPVGSYTLEFWDIAGFAEPVSRSIEIFQGTNTVSETYDRIYSGGTGTTNDPFVIANTDDLLDMGDNPASCLDSHFFILSNDIDLAGYVFHYPIIDHFDGIFNGNRHKIIGLTIRNAAHPEGGGLFGGISGQVFDLGLESVIVTGEINLGSLAGWNEGVISGCYAYTQNSKSDVDTCVGGLVGVNWINGNISNCYVLGSVDGSLAGGLVGDNYGTISNCYSSTDVNGSGDIGGLIGTNRSTSNISSSFWDAEKQTHGVTNTIGLDEGGVVSNVAGLSTTEMQMQSTFTDANWDFNDLDGDQADWKIRDGFGYPLLSWQEYLTGDFAGDYSVNLIDYSLLAKSWGSQLGDINYDPNCNLDNYGESVNVIDMADLFIFCDNWLESPYNALNLNNDLVAYYKMNAISGPVTDQLGIHDGNNYGATRGVTGISNKAFSFDGTDDYVEIPYSPELQIDSDSTITMWIYINNPNDNQTLINQKKTENGHATILLDIENGELRHIDDGASRVYNVYSQPLPANQWVFVSIRKDRILHKNYLGINGLEEEFISSTGSLVQDNNPTFIGKSYWDTGYFNGMIDEIRIYNRTLSHSEIISLMSY